MNHNGKRLSIMQELSRTISGGDFGMRSEQKFKMFYKLRILGIDKNITMLKYYDKIFLFFVSDKQKNI